MADARRPPGFDLLEGRASKRGSASERAAGKSRLWRPNFGNVGLKLETLDLRLFGTLLVSTLLLILNCCPLF